MTSMSRSSDTSHSKPRALRVFLLCAAFLGFTISLYLTFMHYRGAIPPCHIVRGCEAVQTSRYAVIIGIPVALLGTVFFTIMFYMGIGLLVDPSVMLVRSYKVMAYAGALSAIPLFLVQAILLKAYCSYCLATEVVLLSLWAGSFLLTPGQWNREAADGGTSAKD